MPKRLPSQRILNAPGGPNFTQGFLAHPFSVPQKNGAGGIPLCDASDPIIFKLSWTVISRLWCASKLRTEKLLFQVPKPFPVN